MAPQFIVPLLPSPVDVEELDVVVAMPSMREVFLSDILLAMWRRVDQRENNGRLSSTKCLEAVDDQKK
tara:strand:+ start:286 stop:489 length:204 start_codon:yes stop_codon:yes gene_type:complete